MLLIIPLNKWILQWCKVRSGCLFLNYYASIYYLLLLYSSR